MVVTAAKVLLGMSGGVDSSVAAYLLKRQGYEVLGVNMLLWKDKTKIDDDSSLEDARRVAERLGVEFMALDLQDEFKKTIVKYFIDEYHRGNTPNPCVLCNKEIKFGLLYEKTMELGCDYVATGHYAKTEKCDDGTIRVVISDDEKKDQSYVLYNMNQEILSRTLFPTGGYSKEQIREIAKEIGLEVHNKPESQDICFIPDNDYIEFLHLYSDKKAKVGNFVDADGKVLGKHKGITNYTRGQRKGLGIALGRPMYVIDINSKNNSVVLGSNEDLFSKEVILKDVNLVYEDIDSVEYPIRLTAKIRYAAKRADALLYRINKDIFKLVFDEPQRAATRGQSAVFYQDRYVYGGGIIIDSK